MKALEFLTTLNPDSTITVPKEIAVQISQEPKIRVLVLIQEDQDQWAQLTTEQFGQGYAESDQIYDQLPSR
jgi:hypothetical protein